jgi:hypothetical protein
MSPEPLPSGEGYAGFFSVLWMDDQGRFVRKETSGAETAVNAGDLPDFLYDQIVLPKGVTDVFVWVHGWRTDRATALANAQRMFNAIEWVYERRKLSYAKLGGFRPGFVAVSWPSMSWPDPIGYGRIRARTKAMTEDGYAEFFLASLLGYLNPRDTGAGGDAPRTMRSSRGFYVHCLGHSFGGRFVTAAIGAAASPKSKKTLSMLSAVPQPRRKVLSGSTTSDGFAFEIDSSVIFQIAAPNSGFGNELRALLTGAPFRGAFAVTYSGYDRANCLWHRITERGQQAIGCTGATEPKDRLKQITLLSCDSAYATDAFPPRTVVNIDANRLYNHYAWFQAEGAHSDFWYEDSIHLILSVANAARLP